GKTSVVSEWSPAVRAPDPMGLRRDGARGRVVGRGDPRRGPRRPRQLIQILVGQARRAAHARAIARECGGNVLVDRAGRGALGIELGIVLVGLDQRLVHRTGALASDQASISTILPTLAPDPHTPHI